MTLLPIFAKDGSNKPPGFTPGPLHVPPDGIALRVTGGSVKQNGPAGVMDIDGEGLTVIENVVLPEHPPPPVAVYVMV